MKTNNPKYLVNGEKILICDDCWRKIYPGEYYTSCNMYKWITCYNCGERIDAEWGRMRKTGSFKKKRG